MPKSVFLVIKMQIILNVVDSNVNFQCIAKQQTKQRQILLFSDGTVLGGLTWLISGF